MHACCWSKAPWYMPATAGSHRSGGSGVHALRAMPTLHSACVGHASACLRSVRRMRVLTPCQARCAGSLLQALSALTVAHSILAEVSLGISHT